ncbi:MAG: DUF2400 family protein, partial [Helicobacter sp.]|nr:DUF2400 family protein [Helicobacter sp.]
MFNLLEENYRAFNCFNSISKDLPDPLGQARIFKDEKVSLFCALFSYGNAKAITNFLQSCNLYALKEGKSIKCSNKPYRFQSTQDIQALFDILLNSKNLYEIFYKNYKKDSLVHGIKALQVYLYKQIKN